MARTFDGVDDEVNLGLTAYGTWGGLTAAALFRPTSVTVWNTVYNSRISGPLSQIGILVSDTAVPIFMCGNNNELFTTGYTPVAGDWQLWIITKASGTSTPRLHAYNGTSWFHGDYDVARPDPSTSALTVHCIGAYNSSADRFVGDIGTIGVWAGVPSSNNDSAIEAYGWTIQTNWASFSNTRQFYTETFHNGSVVNVDDLSPLNNDETSRTGTTAGAALPSWFSLTPPAGGSTLHVPNVHKNHLGLLTGRA